MSLELFPFLAALGGLTISSGLEASKPKSRVKRSVGTQEIDSALSIFPDASYRLFKKVYKQTKCISSELENFDFDKVNSNVFSVPKNKKPVNSGSDDNFSKNTKSCLSITWKRKTSDDGNKWWGEWSLLWFVGNNNKADIFFNRVYTKGKTLYSEGIAYKLEKEDGEWKGKERVQSGKRKVDKNNKDNLIIKPIKDQIRTMGGEYGGFGDFDTDNVCSNRECKTLKNQEVGKKYWSFVSSSESSSSQSLFNYEAWRNSEKGLFPANRIGQSYWMQHYTQRKTRSTEETIPPSNSINRYSELKGYFRLQKGKVTYKYLETKKKK